jgi:hypothetical protein
MAIHHNADRWEKMIMSVINIYQKYNAIYTKKPIQPGIYK